MAQALKEAPESRHPLQAVPSRRTRPLPTLVIRNGMQARRHIRETERKLRDRLERMEIPGRRRLLRRQFEGPLELIVEQARVSRLNSEVSSWMGREYLGRGLHAAFSSMPPFLSEESRGLFDRFAFAHGTLGNGESVGMYFPGTNHLIMEESMLFTSPAEQRLLVAHEQLHYAAWLGGGGEGWIRWSDGRREARDHSPWLHEGLTELHAQQLVRSNGYAPPGVSYPAETAVSFCIQKIVGEGTLRNAYLTGDFTEVRRRLNARLGENTLEALVGAATIPADSSLAHTGPHIINGSEALAFILERMDGAGVDRSGWRSDPVLGAALDAMDMP